MRKSGTIVKLTVLSATVTLFTMISMLYAGLEALDAMFYGLLVYAFMFLGIASLLELKGKKKTSRSGNSKRSSNYK